MTEKKTVHVHSSNDYESFWRDLGEAYEDASYVDTKKDHVYVRLDPKDEELYEILPRTLVDRIRKLERELTEARRVLGALEILRSFFKDKEPE